MRKSDSLLARLLVAYYGLIQTLHLVTIARAGLMLVADGSLGFPARPPAGGWSAQATYFLVATGAIDAVNIAAAFAFVYGYFTRAKWHLWLGTVTLTIAACSALVFAFGTIASGAWAHHAAEYWLVALLYTPVAILTVLLFGWAMLENRG